MVKILYVADGMQRTTVGILLEERGYKIEIVTNFDAVLLFLKSDPCVVAIIWEVVVSDVMITPDHIARVKNSFPEVRNFGVAGAPRWSSVLRVAGCTEVFQFFDLVEGVCGSL